MLTCLYHPIDGSTVVEDDEGEKLLASGVWFDSPVKAREYKERVESEVKGESESEKKTKKRSS